MKRFDPYHSQSSRALRRGVTLLELSIVIALMTILISISMNVLNQENDQVVKIRDSEKKMKEVEGAINIYIKKYRRLPCPADYTLSFSDANFGKQVRKKASDSTNCNDSNLTPDCRCAINTTEQSSGMIFDVTALAGTIVGGMVPVRDLGLPDSYAIDPWYNRIMYFTVAPYGTVSSRFSTTHSTLGGVTNYGGIQIKNRHNQHMHPPEEKPAYVLVSYGSEGPSIRRNGRVRSGTTFPCTSPGVYYANCNNNASFVDGHYYGSSTTADRFKDIVRWKTIGQLILENGIR